jgi:hypothetical protein
MDAVLDDSDVEDTGLEQIELNSPRPPLGPSVATIDAKDVERYARDMALAVSFVIGLLSTELTSGWVSIHDYHHAMGALRVHLYEHSTLSGTFMARAVVRGRAERYAYVARDYNVDTRLAWDRKDGVVTTKELETYNLDGGLSLTAVESRVHSPVPLASDRYLFGVQTYLYSRESPPETHKVVFCSGYHPHFKCPVDAVNVSGVTAAAVVRQLEDKADVRECELTLVVRVKELHNAVGVNSLVSAVYLPDVKEQLRRRVRLYEDVVHNWDTYYGERRDPKLIENRK